MELRRDCWGSLVLDGRVLFFGCGTAGVEPII